MHSLTSTVHWLARVLHCCQLMISMESGNTGLFTYISSQPRPICVDCSCVARSGQKRIGWSPLESLSLWKHTQTLLFPLTPLFGVTTRFNSDDVKVPLLFSRLFCKQALKDATKWRRQYEYLAHPVWNASWTLFGSLESLSCSWRKIFCKMSSAK